MSSVFPVLAGALPASEIFPHVRIVMGMVIGLGVTTLLSGVARIIQHPRSNRPDAIHLAWVLSMLLAMVHFWWWQFGLYAVSHWSFGTYAFLVGYAIVLFLLCALLFPASMNDYAGYRDYFLARRVWFFGLLAVSYLLDVVDTWIKGEAHFAEFGREYLIRTPVLLVLCAVAVKTRRTGLHALFVAALLTYQVAWIVRFFINP